MSGFVHESAARECHGAASESDLLKSVGVADDVTGEGRFVEGAGSWQGEVEDVQELAHDG